MHIFSRAPEDRPTPVEVYNWRMYACACVIAMSVFGFGYDTSFIGTSIALDSFESDFGLDKMSKKEKTDTTGNLTSLYSVGGFFGAIFMFYTLEIYGRRAALAISELLFAIGAICSTVANGNLGAMYAGRIISGIGIGGSVAVAPTYISELSPPAIRGRMTGLFEAAYQCGSLIGFWMAYGITKHIDPKNSVAWRIPFAVQLIPAGIVLCCLPFIRESPVWLLKKGRDDDTIKALSYIRKLPKSHTYIQEDVSFIKAELELEFALSSEGSDNANFLRYLRNSFKEACAKGVRNRFALVAMLCMLQPWCGAVAINYYSTSIFTSIGLYQTKLWTGVYGVIKSGAAIVFFTFLIDKTGRKWPWIVSCIGCCLCMFYFAGYIAKVHPTVDVPQTPSEEAAGKGAAAMMMLFGFMWSFGANGLPLVIASEVFPPSLRSIGGPFASLNVWLWSFVTTKTTPYMFDSMGYGIYIFFGGILIIAATYAYFYVHETRGLRIDQMDDIFGDVGGQHVDYEKEIAFSKHVEVAETAIPDK